MHCSVSDCIQYGFGQSNTMGRIHSIGDHKNGVRPKPAFVLATEGSRWSNQYHYILSSFLSHDLFLNRNALYPMLYHLATINDKMTLRSTEPYFVNFYFHFCIIICISFTNLVVAKNS